MSKKVLVPLAEGFEEMEAIAIVDILRRGNIEVVTASLTDNLEVSSARHVIVKADTILSKVLEENFDGIALAGGMGGMANLKGDNRILDLIRKLYNSEKLVAAMCASPIVLGEAGVLHGKFTCFPSLSGDVNGNGTYQEKDLVCIEKNVITSKGPATAILFALAIVDYLTGSDNKELRNALLTPLVFK